MLRRSPSAINISEIDVIDMRMALERPAEKTARETVEPQTQEAIKERGVLMRQAHVQTQAHAESAAGSTSNVGDLSTATAATSDSNATVKP